MRPGSNGTPFDGLAQEVRSVAWRNELRGGKPTKVPYAPDGKKAKADDPATSVTTVTSPASISTVASARMVNGPSPPTSNRKTG